MYFHSTGTTRNTTVVLMLTTMVTGAQSRKMETMQVTVNHGVIVYPPVTLQVIYSIYINSVGTADTFGKIPRFR